MNKLFASLAFILIAIFASNVFAEDTAPTQITSGETIGRNVDMGGTYNCSLLGETVKISLSSDVIAAFSCVELESSINIGTCHNAGQRTTRSVTCVNTGTSSTPEWNAEGCTTTTSEVSVDLSYTGYVASSTGGSVALSPLAGACDTGAASLLALPIFN